MFSTDLRTRIESSPLYNPDLAPVAGNHRTWGTYNYAALWVSMSVNILTYMLAASLIQGKRVAPTVRAMVVPGSGLVKQQAEAEGLADIFLAAGFEWREPGCSMCCAMNEDRLAPGERCASTSNRNFEGRQGKGGRTHLVSPAMAAVAAIAGHFFDVRTWS